ncbi:MAG: 4-alpha-glucanotransferase [Lachnospiraceae bacterium]|nr:4-alpha-glucanotransferase [Lachnospiraceae bacterium]
MKKHKTHIRRAGVLLPISSLPSPYGIGTFGKEAYAFVDFLSKAGQSIWQILPLGPTGYGDSPYQSFSTFAGNPYFIDLEELISQGLLTREECDGRDWGGDPAYVDYEKIYFSRFDLLKKAYQRAKKKGLLNRSEYLAFQTGEQEWLEDYALYMAVKNHFGGVSYLEWDEDIRLRKKKAMAKYREKLAEEVDFYKFQQFLFFEQWKKLKAYANKKGISIIGDIPIYVSPDGSDTWSHPELFQLDEKGYPTAVAGCPPDIFSETGQLWGNPLYDWKAHKKTGYAWWLKRLEASFKLYDIVRIDHFRGFDEYWSIPYGDETAVGGKWRKGPGYDLFGTVKEQLGDRPVIAEDLGVMTDSVVKLVKKTGYPGMKIMQFAFSAYGNSEHIPYNYDRNFVVYTGTHDNDTLVTAIKNMPAADAKYAMKYMGVEKRKDLPKAYIRFAMGSCADTCIIPIQDYLGLDNAARINLPSTLGINWKWRLVPGQLTKELGKEMKSLVKIYGRYGQESPR